MVVSKIDDLLKTESNTIDYGTEDVRRTSHISTKHPASFGYSRIANLCTMPPIIQYFGEKVLGGLDDNSADSVVFAVPFSVRDFSLLSFV